jgi:predicted acetyltransferase
VETGPWLRNARLIADLASGETGVLSFVEITTDVVNVASQRVILANGGVLLEQFTKPAAFGNKPGLRYRIYLD